jgi:hypothetical protein
MKKLLLAGLIGPVLFIVTFLVEGATRQGYNPWLMFVSQLSTGPGGWVQIANFLVFGALMLAFALGLRLAIAGTRGSIGAPVLLGLFAIAMLVAGIFTTDPGLGYPVGAPPAHTLHGTIHGFAGLAVFTLLPAACFVMAWHFAVAEHSASWTAYSIGVAVALIVLFFGGFAVGQVPGAPTGLYQRIAIITGWTWIAMVAWQQLQARRIFIRWQTPPEPAPARCAASAAARRSTAAR